MKSFLAFSALLAAANATCDNSYDCGVHVTCQVAVPSQQGQIDCEFPNIRRACCNVFQIGVACSGDQSCATQRLQQLPTAELQFFNRDGGMADICPGIAALQSDIQYHVQEYCHAGFENLEEVSHSAQQTILEGQFAIMTAQQPMPKVHSSVVPGVLGFAVGAAVVTSVVAIKKKRSSGDLYMPLTEDTA